MSEMYKDVFANEEAEMILSEDRQYRSSFKKRLLLSLVYIALTVAFSFFSIIDANIENTLLPMHIPVILGGLVCGGPLGLLIGLVSPIIKYIFFASGAAFSDVICLSFELAICGCISGYLFMAMPKKWYFVAINVAVSLLLSRIAFYVLYYLIMIYTDKTDLGPDVFIIQRFMTSLMGIGLQIVIIPIIVLVFQKTKLAFCQ